MRARLYEHELAKKRVEDDKIEAGKLDINFGSQIRSYVLAPYRLIKDHRTKLAIGDVDRVLDGDLDELIQAYLVFRKTGKTAGDGKDDVAGLGDQETGRRCRGGPGPGGGVDPRGPAGCLSHRNRLRAGRERARRGGGRADLSAPRDVPPRAP